MRAYVPATVFLLVVAVGVREPQVERARLALPLPALVPAQRLLARLPQRYPLERHRPVPAPPPLVLESVPPRLPVVAPWLLVEAVELRRPLRPTWQVLGQRRELLRLVRVLFVIMSLVVYFREEKLGIS